MMSEAKSAGKSEPRAVVQEFTHVTLSTGHECKQHADTVWPQTRELISRLIEDCQPTGWSELELEEKKYPVHMTIEGSNLTCRLCLPCSNGEKAKTAVLIAVALDAALGQSFWRATHVAAGGHTRTSADRPPSQPWIAAMPMVEALIPEGKNWFKSLDYMKMMMWAGDFERSLAYGFASWMASK